MEKTAKTPRYFVEMTGTCALPRSNSLLTLGVAFAYKRLLADFFEKYIYCFMKAGWYFSSFLSKVNEYLQF